MPANHRPRRASRKAAARPTNINLMLARAFAARKAINRAWGRSIRCSLRYAILHVRLSELKADAAWRRQKWAQKNGITDLLDECRKDPKLRKIFPKGISQATVYAALAHRAKPLVLRKNHTIHIFPSESSLESLAVALKPQHALPTGSTDGVKGMADYPPIKPTNPRLVSRREAAGHLSIGMSLLDELIKDGVLRAIRIGRQVKIPTAELDRFIEEQPSYRPGRVA